ncbi:ATP-grasp domain-containing protein [Pararoseomonas indoligenes]|uniref:Alpha-L-glutamate ligase n=1 Tax=Roseomonas indoligenes TaxID=2820811 RepID=A0A940S964_9PROT|nr:alpha-L-glutamate ligase [Pararoseomonas indoligenes]MBP0494923.1 alpha-L-glutamate ligase [Pararoseomonas indoligenes]
MSGIHIIHENPEWLPPLAAALDARGLPWEDWNLSSGTFDLSRPPPEGVFYNRMSASSHTRGHRYSAELTAAVLAWLERFGRRVVNGPRALDLEISKARQYAALETAGVTVPGTVVVRGEAEDVVKAARARYGSGPLILKPNRGGKGLGVRLFADPDALAAFLADAPEDELPADGLWLLQDYIRAARPFITRAEFVGGRFLYAVEVDTSSGFELCPADVCEVPSPSAAVGDAFCPVGETPANAPVAAPRFRVLPDGIPAEQRAKLEGFLKANGIEVAGIEFIRTAEGEVLTYDVNTNTNYNPAAEEAAGLTGTDRSGPGAIAAFLGAELAGIRRAAA